MPVDREGQDQLRFRHIRVYWHSLQCSNIMIDVLHCGRNVLCALWMPSGDHWTITVSISPSLHGNTSVVFHLSWPPLDEHAYTHALLSFFPLPVTASVSLWLLIPSLLLSFPYSRSLTILYFSELSLSDVRDLRGGNSTHRDMLTLHAPLGGH